MFNDNPAQKIYKWRREHFNYIFSLKTAYKKKKNVSIAIPNTGTCKASGMLMPVEGKPLMHTPGSSWTRILV